MLAGINQAAVLGEAGTGYEDANGKGPFECGNCEYFRPSNSSCGQKDMKARSKRPRTDDDRVKVEAKGCCEYVDRIGKDLVSRSKKYGR